MPVLIEAISVVVRKAAISNKLSGGWVEFLQHVPNRTLCFDDDLARVGFMTPDDVRAFVQELEAMGLTYVEGGEARDLAVVDQMAGPMITSTWIEMAQLPVGSGDQTVFACRLVGSADEELQVPSGWTYERSMSRHGNARKDTNALNDLEFVRTDDGVDVFRDRKTGQLMYVARHARPH
jgi:hypothetical protein